jgi:tetratricopeptide (TPR) repeat protein
MAALATETYDRVLAIDPENSTALAWMAEKAMADDPVRAARLLEKAASINPTDVFVNWQAIELALELGRLDLAIEISEYLVVRDPLLFWGQLNLADYYFEAGRVDDAMHRYEIALSLNENAGAVRWKYGLARLMNGDPEGALGQFEMEPGKVYKLMGLAAAYHDLGRYEDSARTFAELIELEADKWPWGIARAYGWIGDADQAFFWLERTRETDPGYLGGVERIPLLQKLHSDPRWLPLLRSVGRAPEQIPAVEFNFKVPG